MTPFVSTILFSVAKAIAAKIGMELVKRGETKRIQEEAFAAGKAAGIAEESKRREHDVLNEKPPSDPGDIVDDINDLMRPS